MIEQADCHAQHCMESLPLPAERVKLIKNSYSKEFNERILIFDRVEKPILLSFHDIQDKEDKYYFVPSYYKFMKINKVTLK